MMDKCKDDLETVVEEEVDGYQIQTTLYKIEEQPGRIVELR